MANVHFEVVGYTSLIVDVPDLTVSGIFQSVRVRLHACRTCGPEVLPSGRSSGFQHFSTGEHALTCGASCVHLVCHGFPAFFHPSFCSVGLLRWERRACPGYSWFMVRTLSPREASLGAIQSRRRSSKGKSHTFRLEAGSCGRDTYRQRQLWLDFTLLDFSCFLLCSPSLVSGATSDGSTSSELRLSLHNTACVLKNTPQPCGFEAAEPLASNPQRKDVYRVDLFCSFDQPPSCVEPFVLSCVEPCPFVLADSRCSRNASFIPHAEGGDKKGVLSSRGTPLPHWVLATRPADRPMAIGYAANRTAL